MTYGSLGSVIALMFWLYLTSIVILIGGEINGLRERHKSLPAS
jgi:membrane protein